MSITWLVLVLPATFAEVIGLSLVKPGRDGYLDVQVYTGFMFIGAFIFSKSRPPYLFSDLLQWIWRLTALQCGL